VQIARQCQLKLCANDEVVFQQGDEPDACYTLMRGAVSIYALNSSLSSVCRAVKAKDQK
jgi:CRP-like cAMP-binding protein